MIAVAFEYNYINLDRDIIRGSVNNKILEHIKNNGDGLRKIESKYNIEFFDEIRNKTRSITTKRRVNK